MNDATMNVLGHGFYYEEMPIGFKFLTKGRTITETDLVSYVNLTWYTQELFVNVHGRGERSLKGRVVPAGLLFAFAEGLVHPSLEYTGQALLGTTLKVLRPTYVGDTIRVDCEVTAARVESKGRRGLVTTQNRVITHQDETVLVYEPQRLILLRTPISADAPHSR